MSKYRMLFTKTGRAVYISHLDLMHTFQRAFSRSGYRLNYSEGFNPHPAISIALPLGVGSSSYCEIIDFSGDEPNVDVLNSSLPEGIKILSLYIPERKASEIKYLRVKAELMYDSGIIPDVESVFKNDTVFVMKKGKKGEQLTDIKPMIREITFSENGFEAVISAQNPTLNPDYIIKAMGDMQPDFAKFTRLEIYDEEMNIFR